MKIVNIFIKKRMGGDLAESPVILTETPIIYAGFLNKEGKSDVIELDGVVSSVSYTRYANGKFWVEIAYTHGTLQGKISFLADLHFRYESDFEEISFAAALPFM